MTDAPVRQLRDRVADELVRQMIEDFHAASVQPPAVVWDLVRERADRVIRLVRGDQDRALAEARTAAKAVIEILVGMHDHMMERAFGGQCSVCTALEYMAPLAAAAQETEE